MENITLSPGRVSALLDELSIKHGYCEATWSKCRLANNPPKTIGRFTDVVIEIEGMTPRACDHRKQLRAIVERYFIAEAQDAELARLNDGNSGRT